MQLGNTSFTGASLWCSITKLRGFLITHLVSITVAPCSAHWHFSPYYSYKFYRKVETKENVLCIFMIITYLPQTGLPQLVRITISIIFPLWSVYASDQKLSNLNMTNCIRHFRLNVKILHVPNRPHKLTPKNSGVGGRGGEGDYTWVILPATTQNDNTIICIW